MDIRDIYLFDTEGWFTPNTYDKNFKAATATSGVYMLIAINLDTMDKQILYVGSAKNLLQRYSKHEVMRVASNYHEYIRFYFKETENYISEEIALIKKFKPILNKQHNG